MSEVGTPRAKLVELLWQLKLGYDNRVSGRSIHFNTLLRDSDYRREFINEAALSNDGEIRRLGLSLKMLNVDGELTQAREPRQQEVNPDITETLNVRSGGQPGSRSKLPPIIGLAVLLMAVATALGVLLSNGSNEVRVSGSLQGDQHWSADKTWLLEGIVYLESGSRLSIEAGSVVKGAPGSALIVTRDASLVARGTVEAPVVFTSARPEGQRQAGDWGGVVLLGNAPVNQRRAQIEGVPRSDERGSFGGSQADSSCGVLTYTRIEFAGYEVYANNELNGLTLGGCGRGTIIRHVQIHRALDDGIEVFGGNVDMRHILVTGAGDDSLDWDMGWRGRVQFMQLVQYPGIGDNAIEADNLVSRFDAQPVSEPQIYNATLLSSRSREKYQRAITLRRGSGGHFRNMIISGFSREAIDIKDVATVARLDSGQLSFSKLLISDMGATGQEYFPHEAGDSDDDGGFNEEAFISTRTLLGENLQLQFASSDLLNPSFTIAAASPASYHFDTPPQEEFWDEGVDYSGAVRPGVTPNWMDGWTAYPIN